MCSRFDAVEIVRDALMNPGMDAYEEPRDPDQNALTALWQLQHVAEAAEARLDYGHDDTCDAELGLSDPVACSCGHDDLGAALAAAGLVDQRSGTA